MAEISQVAKRFGKFIFLCDFADSEEPTVFSKHVHYILIVGRHKQENSSKMFRAGYLLLDLADLNENITFELRSFSLEDDS